ncbi:MAG: hypothetical protein ACR2LJ_03955 [Acidimicrobiales bacterium]
MPTWRRLAIVGVSGFVVAVAIWAFRPWTSAVSFPAVNNKTTQATFRCGAPFGGNGVDPSNDRARSGDVVPHRPCTTRTARRGLAAVDVVLGGVGLVALASFRRPQSVAEVDTNT